MFQIKINDNCAMYLEECSNPLRRIAIDFAHDSLADKLEELSVGDYSVFVIEGVFMYLGSEAIESTINAIHKLYPKHMLYCDLMTNKPFTRLRKAYIQNLLHQVANSRHGLTIQWLHSPGTTTT
jgi:O-methyltransferase involved in polyketide biosynthesis